MNAAGAAKGIAARGPRSTSAERALAQANRAPNRDPTEDPESSASGSDHLALRPTGLFVPPPQLDEYRILRTLGRGGMGQVFLGHDSLLDRPVAVKFLVTASPTEQARLRFLQEARAIARLQHPNVVAIYRVGIFSGLPYLVSEYVTGPSLNNLPTPLPWQQVLRIGLDLARGLCAVHRHGVLHRDIKPADGTAEGDCRQAVPQGAAPGRFYLRWRRDAARGNDSAWRCAVTISWRYGGRNVLRCKQRGGRWREESGMGADRGQQGVHELGGAGAGDRADDRHDQQTLAERNHRRAYFAGGDFDSVAAVCSSRAITESPRVK